MSLKIIGGEFGGRKLFTSPDLKTRPTASRMREALFSILAFCIKDTMVLDLFAGSGALGLEALSRGAQNLTLVENDRNACEIIIKNIKLCKVDDHARLVCSPVERFKGLGLSYDLVLMDPPYGVKLVDLTLNILKNHGLLKPSAIIVAEHETGYSPIFDTNVYQLMQLRTYGKGALSFYQYKPFEVTK